MFAGKFRHMLDNKGRLTIPSRLREAIPREKVASFWVTLGMEGCLYIYTPQVWEKLVNQLPTGISTKDKRTFIRLFFSNATPCDWDKQGRILIPDELRKAAGIEKNVVIVGALDHIEVWDAERWDEFQRENLSKYEEYADKLFTTQTGNIEE